MATSDTTKRLALDDPARLGHLKKWLLIGLERKRQREAAAAAAAGEKAS